MSNANYSPIRYRGQSNQIAPVSSIAKEDHHNVVSTVKRRVAREEVEMATPHEQVSRYRNPGHKGRYQKKGEDDYDYAVRV